MHRPFQKGGARIQTKDKLMVGVFGWSVGGKMVSVTHVEDLLFQADPLSQVLRVAHVAQDLLCHLWDQRDLEADRSQ